MIPSLVAAADDFVPGRRCRWFRPWWPLQTDSSLVGAGRDRPW